MRVQTYNPLDPNFITVSTVLDNRGQRSIRLILDVINNEFYTLDDDNNFRSLGYEKSYIDYYLSGTGGTIVVSSTTQYYLATGDTPFVSGLSNDGLIFYPSTSRIVNESGRSVTISITGIVSISSGNNNEIHAAIFKNGQIIPSSEQEDITGSGGRAAPIPFQCTTVMNQNDYIDVRLKNSTSTTNINIRNLNVIIREL